MFFYKKKKKLLFVNLYWCKNYYAQFLNVSLFSMHAQIKHEISQRLKGSFKNLNLFK